MFKVYFNDEQILEINDIQEKVLLNEIKKEIFLDDMKRRLQWVINHKYEQCFERLKKEWEPKLIQRGHELLPAQPEAFAQLVFEQEDYKNRDQREGNE